MTRSGNESCMDGEEGRVRVFKGNSLGFYLMQQGEELVLSLGRKPWNKVTFPGKIMRSLVVSLSMTCF